MLLAVEFGPAQNGRESEEQKHRVQENEPANGGVGVLKEHRECNQIDRIAPEVQFFRGVVGQWHTERAKSGIENSHKSIVDFCWVGLARLELEGSVVAGQVARKADQHLAQGRMHIEVKFAFEVVGAEFAETI